MDAILLHVLWWLIGFVCGMVVMAALSLSNSISRASIGEWEEFGPENEPAQVDERITAANATLKDMEAKADFYYRMATDDKRK